MTSPVINVRGFKFTTFDPTLLLKFDGIAPFDPRITFTRASAATRTNSTGLLESVASNVPRIDYDPVTLACKGLLIEESRTNLLTYSEQFDNAAWGKSRCTVTANAITAPDGTLTADKMVEDTQTGPHHLNRGGVAFVSGTTYTISQHVKAAERNKCALGLGNGTIAFNGGIASATFDLVAKTASKNAFGLSAGIQELSGGWFRVWLTGTADATGNDSAFAPFLNNGSTANYTGDGTSGLYVWGAQLEVGSFPTSYVPTTTTAVTRAADAASMTGANFSSWYRQDEGTFVVGWNLPVTTSDNHFLFSVSATGGALPTIAMRMGYAGGSRRIRAYGQDAGSVFQYAVDGPVNSSTQGTSAFAWTSLNNAAVSDGGAAVVSDATGALAGWHSEFRLRSSSGICTNGHISRIAYYQVRLANAELQALTTP